MNREIKFRAWNGAEMSEPFNITSITKDDKYSGVVHEYRGMMDESFFYLYECQIMQFTGLTDKNGKEIYEGDCFVDTNGYFRKVEFSGFEIYPFFAGSPDRATLLPNDIEIIGNIYENPELIQ